MDRRRMDADRDRVVHRDRRGRKFAVVVAVQNVLLAACLVVTLYVYWDVQRRKPTSGGNVHIQFEPIVDISGNATLQFSHVYSSNKMSLVGKNNDTIYVNCTGPYVLYMDVCYIRLRNEESEGKLHLQVAGNKTPVSSFKPMASHEICSGHNSIAYLRANEKASLYLSSSNFKVKSVTVGLSYLLATCEY